MTGQPRAERRLLLDAATIISGTIGRADSPASMIIATVRLGGLAACAPDNAIVESGRHLMEYYNAGRLKISHAETKRELDALRTSPTFTVLPWVNAPQDLLAANHKDAYLLEAIRLHGDISALLTYDKELLEMTAFEGVPIISPRTWIEALEATDL